MSKTSTIITIVFAVLGIGVATYFGPDLRRHFGGRYADADREIHQQSLSMVRGTIDNVQRLKLEYAKAEGEGHRAAIREMVLVAVASIDETKLPPHLRSWVQELRRIR